MTVKEIVSQCLVDRGFDGLYNDNGECGCLRDDLAPCGEMSELCEAGYRHPGGEGYDFSVRPRPYEAGEGEEV